MSASESASSCSSTELSATSRPQDAKWSSLSVAPAGLGYIATTHSVVLLRRKNASPIGSPNPAQSSSGIWNSSSQSVRMPTGR